MERQNTSGSVVVRIYLLDDPGHGAMAVPAEDSHLSQGEQIQDRFAVTQFAQVRSQRESAIRESAV